MAAAAVIHAGKVGETVEWKGALQFDCVHRSQRCFAGPMLNGYRVVDDVQWWE